MLDIYAGETAIKTIKQQGFSADLFTQMLGASGGPKWFTLFGLDKYLFGEFFKNRTQELNLIGSSAGAFRFGALAQNDPVAAITRLATHYSETVYFKKADAAEITTKAMELLDAVYGDSGVDEIINNPVYKVHFVVAKCHGLTAFENKFCQFLGLLSSIGLNRLNRGLLTNQYQRFVFHHPKSKVRITDKHHFNTVYQPLSTENLKQALLASGSIPMVMQGVRDIPQAPKGMYRDGGIIDYHFDVNIAGSDGLTLYPHFNATPKAGWFDKNLSRSVSKEHYKNVVMLVPSDDFIAGLPFQKIPDRKDFTEMDAPTRIQYWRTVLAETDRLAQAFDEFLSVPDVTKIIPI